MAKDDLISRAAVWALVGDDVMTVRPGSQLDTVIKRYANAIDGAPAVDAVPIKAISAWLAAYAIPPLYASEAIGVPINTDATHKALAWEYHWKHLIDCGLLREESDEST